MAFTGYKPSQIGKYERGNPSSNPEIEVLRRQNYIQERKHRIYNSWQSGDYYTEGPYFGIPTIEEPVAEPGKTMSPAELEEFEKRKYWLAEMFLDVALEMDYRSFRASTLIDLAIDENGNISDSQMDEFDKLVKNSEYYRRPVTITKDKRPHLHYALQEFLEKNYKENLTYTKNKKADYFLYWLLKNLTNSDIDDLVSYVKRYTDFTTDKTFKNLSDAVLLTTIEDINFYTMNVDEFEAGLETPYLMLFWAEDNKNTSVMPYIRYGIENTEKGKIAYIYAVQRRNYIPVKQPELEKPELEKRLDRIFAGANSSVKENRNITPSMVCVLASFMGMLKAKGITEVKAPDFIARRWGEFWQVRDRDDEKQEQIQSNATDKFLRSLIRLDQQFNGIDLIALPNDVDSYLHLKLSRDITTTNATLAKFFNVGYQAAQLTSTNLATSPVLPKQLERPDDKNNEKQKS